MRAETKATNREIDVILEVTSDLVGPTHIENLPTELDMLCHYMHKLNHGHCRFLITCFWLVLVSYKSVKMVERERDCMVQVLPRCFRLFHPHITFP